MEIKVYTHKSGQLSRACLQSISLKDIKLVEVDDQRSAELNLLTGMDDLRELYNDKQLFCVIQTNNRQIPQQPKNVCIVNSLHLFDIDSGLPRLVEMIQKDRSQTSVIPEAVVPKFSDITVFKRKYTVLVIDDTEQNLRIAKSVLEEHSVTVVSTVRDAMLKLGQVHFDAVLTDMEMSPDKYYSSLDLDVYGVTEKIPYGFAVILEMTKRGMPVAVVTDGDHHESWVSAMFDHIKEAYINGQKVLFFNNIGKRWDKALKCLMEE